MTDSCVDQTNLGLGEPGVTCWSDVGCSGTGMTLSVQNYSTLQGLRLSGAQIVGIWIPPHLSAKIYSQENYLGSSMTLVSGRTYKNLSSPNLGVGAGEIRSIKISQIMPWKDFKSACCRGDQSVSSDACQIYWGSGDNNTGNCDSVMDQYCKEKPYDEVCGCLLSDFPDGLGVCFDRNCVNMAAYQNTNQRRLLSQGCPDKITCTQQLILGAGARDNIIDAKMYQICPGVDTNTSTGTPPSITVDRGVVGLTPDMSIDPSNLGILPLTDAQRAWLKSHLGTNYETLVVVFILVIIYAILFSGGSQLQYPQYPQTSQNMPYPMWR